MPSVYAGNLKERRLNMKNNSEVSVSQAPRPESGGSFGFLLSELDRLFNFPAATGSSHSWNPISAHETESAYRYDLELPGLKKEGLKVTLSEGVLAVKGRKRLFRDGTETSVEVERSLLVPEDVDPEKIQARYVDGILTLEFSKREEAKPKAIEIRVG